MPRRANYTNIPRIALPVVVQFGNGNPAEYDGVLPNLQCYEYNQIGRFLYFRFDDKNWIPKKALGHYNREWVRLQLGIHDGNPAKRIFFQVRDNTMSNFVTGLAEVVNLWLDGTESGANYRAQYIRRRRQQVTARNNARTNNTYIAPEDPAIGIATTRFPRGLGFIPNAAQQRPGIAGPAAGPPDVQLFLDRYLPFFTAFVRRPRYVKHIWRYNLQCVSEGFRDTWNSQAEDGHPAVPLFAALRDVVEVLAPKMLIHVLENRCQQWQASLLGDAFAKTMRITMNVANVAMEPLNAAGIGGVRANNCDELVLQDGDEVL